MTESRYEKLGVDIHKKGIEVFKPSIRTLFPTAFCAVKHDPQFPEYALVAHADGAGSKPVQSYLNYKETEEAEAFRGIGQDVVAMNLNDILCVGAAPISFVDYVALNKSKVPKEALLKILSEEFAELIELLREYGITLPFDGGETCGSPGSAVNAGCLRIHGGQSQVVEGNHWRTNPLGQQDRWTTKRGKGAL